MRCHECVFEENLNCYHEVEKGGIPMTQQCPDCSGTGFLGAPLAFNRKAPRYICPTCSGTGRVSSPEPDDWLQECLDQLATTVHNLSPGDIGSMDRVLIPIALAKQEIIDTYERRIHTQVEQAEQRGAAALGRVREAVGDKRYPSTSDRANNEVTGWNAAMSKARAAIDTEIQQIKGGKS